MSVAMIDNVLETYRHSGITLMDRVTPQPHLYGSYEQNIVRILLYDKRGCISIPKTDPIYFALLLIFSVSEEDQWLFNTVFLQYGSKHIFGEDFEKIFNALEIFYGSCDIYDKLVTLCIFDSEKGFLKYGM